MQRDLNESTAVSVVSAVSAVEHKTEQAIPSVPDEDFFSLYLDFMKGGEPPAVFHRWTAIGILSAWLGREIYFSHNSSRIHPNMYIMVSGEPGTRKSTAIKAGKRLLTAAGYKKFAAEKTSKEKFLEDLSEGIGNENMDVGSILDQNLFGSEFADSKDVLICADEFSDFFGNNVLEFVSMLGVMWDFHGTYDYRIKGGSKVLIENPTINILSGNTPTQLNKSFPPEIIGQGFFSRLLMIYSEPTGIKIAFPPPEDVEKKQKLVEYLGKIRNCLSGEMFLSPEAKDLLERIYKKEDKIEDPRFAHFETRRFTHLIKLCMLHAAARCSQNIEKKDVRYANTVLAYAEHYMPKALGEFGASKNSAAKHKVLSYLESCSSPVTMGELMAKLLMDVGSRDEVISTIGDLSASGKIQTDSQNRFLAKRAVFEERYDEFVDYSFLTKAELR